jgi:hypothetical protein
MNKIGNFLITCIRMLSGCFLLLLVILTWILGLWFRTVIEVVTWFELKLTRLMKKAFGEDIERL